MIVSGAIAAATALLVLFAAALALAGTLRSLGWLTPFGMLLAVTASLFAAGETFRSIFNGLCERWSNDPEPPYIPAWRPRRILGA